MSNTALILGAGAGTRMGLEQSKLLLDMGGKTVLEHSVQAFYNHPMVDNVIVVCRACDLEAFQSVLKQFEKLEYVIGGNTRQKSVANALTAVPVYTELLIIHDGARPLVTGEVIACTIQAAIDTGAAAAGVPVKDTIKVTDANGMVVSTPQRSTLFSIQTPQVFQYPLYIKAMDAARQSGLDLTDDCQLAERIGLPVQITAGEYSNLKITTKEDVPLALSILNSREGSK